MAKKRESGGAERPAKDTPTEEEKRRIVADSMAQRLAEADTKLQLQLSKRGVRSEQVMKGMSQAPVPSGAAFDLEILHVIEGAAPRGKVARLAPKKGSFGPAPAKLVQGAAQPSKLVPRSSMIESGRTSPVPPSAKETVESSQSPMFLDEQLGEPSASDARVAHSSSKKTAQNPTRQVVAPIEMKDSDQNLDRGAKVERFAGPLSDSPLATVRAQHAVLPTSAPAPISEYRPRPVHIAGQVLPKGSAVEALARHGMNDRQIQMAISNQGGSAVFQMKTEQGSDLAVRLRVHDGRAELIFRASQPDLAQSVQNSVSELVRSLSEAGIEIAGVQIETTVSDHSHSQDRPEEMMSVGSDESPEITPGDVVRRATGLVDIIA
ncbi:MAG: flagellar hook-length control protein FliK [Myxococcales bacterium]|nr:flagellar hook-length control protein FliK [Myxococcales bacterium]